MTIDIQVAKDAARGHWPLIAAQVLRIPDDYLTGKQGPCPKCECGTDRWRVFKDFAETGGAMCNQCGKSADGFALAQWFLDCSLNEAIEKVCNFLGVEDPAKSKKRKKGPARVLANEPTNSEPADAPKPTKDLPITLRPWNDKHFAMCFESKKPITMEAVKLAGGTVAKHYSDTVMAFPCIGRDGKPTGWAMYNITGGPIKWRPNENEPYQDLKIKLIGCQGGGWIGRINPNRPDDPIFKVEGVSDMLAILSANPEASVVTNANGAGQDPLAKDRQWMLETFRGRVVYTIHDRDDAGFEGATWIGTDVKKRPGWAVAISLVAKESKNVDLPFEMNSKKPNEKDVRDFFNDRLGKGSTMAEAFQELVDICEQSPVMVQPKGYSIDAVTAEHEQNVAPKRIANYRTKYIPTDDGGVSRVDEPVPILEIADQIFEHGGGWPKSVGNQLFTIGNGQIRILRKPSSLFAWLRESIDVDFRNGSRLPTKEEMFEIIQNQSQRFESVESFPHFPRISGVHYTCEDRPPGDGRYLQRFLDFFCPSSPIDRQLLLAAIATTFWGGHPGGRPGFQFSSTTGQGAGKTTTAATIAKLSGGSIDFDQSAKREEITKRLLNGDSTGRVVLLDNIKAQTFSSASFESLITAKAISGHQMYQGNASRPNHFTFFITFNSASFSRDMAQRLVTIVLADAPKKSEWQSEVDLFIQEYRMNVIDDIRSFFLRPSKKLSKLNRWAAWQGEIASRLDDPESVIEEIENRESANDADRSMADDIVDFICEFLADFGYETPYRIHIAANALTSIVREAVGTMHSPKESFSLIDRLIASGLIKNMKRNPCKSHQRGFLFASVDGFSEIVQYDLADRIQRRANEADIAREKRREKARQDVASGP